MIQSRTQRWGEMLRRTLETRSAPQGLIADHKMADAGSTPANDDETDLVAWAKRVGEADLFS